MKQALRLTTAVAALTIGISAAAAQVRVMTPGDNDTWIITDEAGTEYRVLVDPAGRPAECPDNAYFVSEFENDIPTRVTRCEDENDELELRAAGADDRTAAGEAFPEGSLLGTPPEETDDDDADEATETNGDTNGDTETPTTPESPPAN